MNHLKTKIIFLFFIFPLLLMGIVLPLWLVAVALESTPLITHKKALGQEDIGRIKSYIQQHDPRKLKNGDIKSLPISERQLNLLVDYALLPYKDKIQYQASLHADFATAFFTITLPENPIGKYLNIIVKVAPEEEYLKFETIQIGSLAMPGRLFNIVGSFIIGQAQRHPDLMPFLDAIESIEKIMLKKDQIVLLFKWDKNLAGRLKDKARKMVISDSDRNRMAQYYRMIASLSHETTRDKASMATFLKPLFALALERSQRNGDHVEENRALILSLTFFSLSRSPQEWIGNFETKKFNKPRKLSLLLFERNDLPKHFLVSAAIASTADSSLSNVVGVFKEMDDSAGGTGFSFADLAADRAGICFAETATGSRKQAKILQQRMNDIKKDTDFMPRIDGLPEGIMELEFKKKFHDLDNEAYKMVEKEIDHRIAECSLYR